MVAIFKIRYTSFSNNAIQFRTEFLAQLKSE
jgi:hypothetical protein